MQSDPSPQVAMLAAREARDAFFYSHIVGLGSQRHVRSMPPNTWQDDSALIVLMAKELFATASMLKQSTSALTQVYHCFSLAFWLARWLLHHCFLRIRVIWKNRKKLCLVR